MARDTAPRAALGGAVDKRAAGVGARWRGDPHRPCPGVLARAARFWPLLYNDWHPLCAATWLAYLLEKSRGLRSGTKIHLLSRWRPRRRPPVALSSAPAVHASHQPWLHRRGNLSLTPRAPTGHRAAGGGDPGVARLSGHLYSGVRDVNVAAPDPQRRATLGCTASWRCWPRRVAECQARLRRHRGRLPRPTCARGPCKSPSCRPPPRQDIPTLFPVQGDIVSPGAPPTERTSHGVTMTFPLLSGRPPPARLRFVMVVGDRAWESEDVLVRPAAQALPDVLPAHLSLWWVLGAALVGGLVLNLMPCVFPVLAIKLLALVQAEQTPTRRLHEGLGYTLGVLTTFGALGAVFLALRATGAAFGWGFQLQSPVIVLGLVVVFWLMALNLLGVFEWGIGLMALAGRQRTTGHASLSSAFLTGMLAVFVAAPCTGPFMGTALGAAATLPAPAAMAIFLGLGCGLALPFLVVACFPTATAWVPKAGPWMETLKHGCAFPLFATVVWLLWVLGRQTGSDGWLIAAVLLLVLSFSLWLGRFTATCSPRRRLGAGPGSVAVRQRADTSAGRAAVRRLARGVGRLRAGFTASNTRKKTSGVRRLHCCVVPDLPGE